MTADTNIALFGRLRALRARRPRSDEHRAPQRTSGRGFGCPLAILSLCSQHRSSYSHLRTIRRHKWGQQPTANTHGTRTWQRRRTGPRLETALLEFSIFHPSLHLDAISALHSQQTPAMEKRGRVHARVGGGQVLAGCQEQGVCDSLARLKSRKMHSGP